MATSSPTRSPTRDTPDPNPYFLYSFTTDLLSSRIVNVYADSDSPYGIPEFLIKTRSPFLYEAIEAPNEDDDEAYLTLTYPHGDLEITPSDDACVVVLHWLTLGTLPTSEEIELETLVHCICMATAWSMPDFHDVLMLELLRLFDKPPHPLELIEAVKLSFSFPSPNSKLRRLLLEELINAIYIDKSLPVSSLEKFDGVSGFLAEFALVHERLGKKDERFGGRFEAETEKWREYLMDGAGPGRHWVWQGR